MGVIRAGGLASGLDTNTIVEQLVEAQKQPIYALENQRHLITLEQSMYKNINTDLTALKNSIFTLKMENTFRSKTINSSNPSAANAKVTAEAATGSHIIDVVQTAKNASMTSKFTNSVLFTQGAGVARLSGMSVSLYDQQEGSYLNTVGTTTPRTGSSGVPKTIAQSVFTSTDNKIYVKSEYQGDMLSSFTTTSSAGVTATFDFVDEDGNIDANSMGTQYLNFTINTDGTPINLTNIEIDFVGKAGTDDDIDDINELMFYLEESLNADINTYMGTNYEQYVSLRADYDANENTWRTAIYNTSQESFVIGAVADSTGKNPGLAEALGLDKKPYHSMTKEIHKYIIAPEDDYDTLQEKLESLDKTITVGLQMTFATAGITDGTFEYIQDSSMNTLKATKTRSIGVPVTNGTLTLSAALTSSGLSDIDKLSGTFTINNVKITITSATRTINEVMAIVNSSGAGVTMTYDESLKRFTIADNDTGPESMQLGGAGDNSQFFNIFKLNTASGAARVNGVTEGTLSVTNPLNQAGFSRSASVNTGTFSINGIPIYVDVAKDSVNDIMRKVNNSAAGVTMAYDANMDKFVFTSKTADMITFGGPNDTSQILYAMNVTRDYKSAVTIGEPGQNAIVKVDGQTYQRSSNVVDDVLTGVTLTLTSPGSTTLEIGVDSDKAVTALANFIKGYNTLITKLKPDQISKEDRSDYMTPLTEAEKEAKSDDDLKDYNTKYDGFHTQDLMLKSREISTLATALRGNIMTEIPTNESMFKSLGDIGFEIAGDGDITITQKGYLMTMSTDIEEIKTALTDNADIMENLLTNSDEVYRFFAEYDEEINSATGERRPVHDSWANRYERMVTEFQDIEGYIGAKVRSDSALSKRMDNIDKEIDRQSLRAETYLEMLWRQFTYMETRVSQINNQAQYLASIGGSSGATNPQAG
jgi:flagellar hook-associated protein 2